MDFAYVRHPQFLDIKIATKEMVETYLKTTIDFMIERRKKNKRFKMDEILKLERIYNDCIAHFKKNINVNEDRFRFVQFVNEYDRRRNKNFLEIFPEYKEFYKLCENSNV
jgi:CII-binding regulator of phage lambda lysogenization HflD